MCLLITGAAGFVGRAVSRRLSIMDGVGPVRLIDRRLPDPIGGFEVRQVDLLDREQLAWAVDGVTRVMHLASIAGGAAEIDPVASRAVNLDATLNLIETLGRLSARARFVYASSIAVFGEPGRDVVTDLTLPIPRLTYGAHKLMVEHAVADATRRGLIDGVALRLPGIVARPAGDRSAKSGFISDLFWSIPREQPQEVPVPPTATLWLLSIEACVTALLHALLLIPPMSLRSGITLPALRVTMAELIAAIATAAGREATQIIYRPDPGLTANFGAYPPLSTATADGLGFRHDGDLLQLVASSAGYARS